MIGLSFIVRILQFCFYFALAGGLVLLVVFTVSRVISFTASLLGSEVWDFGRWLTHKIRENKAKREARREAEKNELL